MANKRSNLISVGRITGVFGIKGWVKVNTSTEPKENIVKYSPWWLKTRHGVKAVEIDDYSFRPQGLVVHIKGVDDRDSAADYARVDVAIERNQLPDLDDGDFYWDQLIGLQVVSVSGESPVVLGQVKDFIETGANDVIVIQATESSIDDQERLVPYVPDTYVKSISLEDKEIQVDWDPDF